MMWASTKFVMSSINLSQLVLLAIFRDSDGFSASYSKTALQTIVMASQEHYKVKVTLIWANGICIPLSELAICLSACSEIVMSFVLLNLLIGWAVRGRHVFMHLSLCIHFHYFLVPLMSCLAPPIGIGVRCVEENIFPSGCCMPLSSIRPARLGQLSLGRKKILSRFVWVFYFLVANLIWWLVDICFDLYNEAPDTYATSVSSLSSVIVGDW